MTGFDLKISALVCMGAIVSQARAQPGSQPGSQPDSQRWLVVLSKGSGNTYGGVPLLEGKWIDPGKNLRTGPDGAVKVISKRGVLAVLAPNSEILFSTATELKKIAGCGRKHAVGF